MAAINDQQNNLSHKKIFDEIQRITSTGNFVWDVATNTVEWSNALFHIFGIDPQSEKVTSETFFNAIYPEGRQRIKEIIGDAVTNRRPQNTDFRIFRPEGDMRILEMCIEVITGESGNVTQILGVCQDITDHRRSETALHETESDLQKAFEIAAIGRWKYFVTKNQYIWTESAKKVIGFPADNIPRTWEEYQQFFHPDDLEAVLAAVEVTKTSGKFELEHRLIINGKTKWVRTKSHTEFDEQEQQLIAIGIIQDITNRKIFEESLRESEARWQFALDGAGDGVWDWDVPNREVFYSSHWKAMLGFCDDEIGNGIEEWEKRVHPDDKASVYEILQQHISGETPFYQCEHRMLCKNGEYKWILDRGKIISRSDSGAPLRMIGTHTDITDRKQFEEHLKQKEAEYRRLANNIPDMIARFDSKLRHIYVNKRVCDIAGATFDELIGKTNRDLDMPEQIAGPWEKTLQSVFDSGTEKRLDFNFETTIGNRYFESRVSPEFAANGAVVSVLAITRDITDRKKALAEIQQSQQKLRALAEHLVNVREVERTGIAREIHDEFGQILTVLKMDLSMVENELKKENGPPDYPRIFDEIESMKQLLDSTAEFVSNMITRLRPEVLDKLGLLPAIEWHSEEFEKYSGIKCQFNSNIDSIDLDNERATAVFRIVQESLTNVARHAKATAVSIDIQKAAPNRLTVTIKDNGIGFDDTSAAKTDRFGLLGMRERVKNFGGNIQISSAVDAGTTVFVSLPILPPEAKNENSF